MVSDREPTEVLKREEQDSNQLWRAGGVAQAPVFPSGSDLPTSERFTANPGHCKPNQVGLGLCRHLQEVNHTVTVLLLSVDRSLFTPSRLSRGTSEPLVMSAISGISVSQELSAAFTSAVESGQVRFIKVSVQNGH